MTREREDPEIFRLEGRTEVASLESTHQAQEQSAGRSRTARSRRRASEIERMRAPPLLAGPGPGAIRTEGFPGESGERRMPRVRGAEAALRVLGKEA